MAEARKTPDRSSCPQCGNRLRVLPDQVGTTVRCPKCNAAFILGAGPPPPGKAPRTAAPRGKKPRDRVRIVPEAEKPELRPPPAPVASDDDAYEPEIPLRPTFIVPEEPAVELRATADEVSYDADWSTAEHIDREAVATRPGIDENVYLESARRRGLLRSRDVLEPPRWTFLSGVFTYPWCGVNAARWTAVALGAAIAGPMILATLELLGFVGSSPNMVLGVLLLVFTLLLTLLTLSYATVCCQAAIQDTADGHDRPTDALPDNWVLTLLAWIYLWAGAGALGLPLSMAIGPLAYLLTSTLVFPVLLLSAMESDSFLLPFSPSVVRSLFVHPHRWLMFYLVSTAVVTAWIVAFDAVAVRSPYLALFLSGPVLAAMVLIYGRLLGRLAWRISGAPMAEVDRPESAAGERGAGKPAAGGKRRKRRRSRVLSEFPQDGEPGDLPPEPPPLPSYPEL